MLCLCCVGIVIVGGRRDRGKRGNIEGGGGEGHLFRLIIPPF